MKLLELRTKTVLRLVMQEQGEVNIFKRGIEEDYL
jgi:hypothetical protein